MHGSVPRFVPTAQRFNDSASISYLFCKINQFVSSSWHCTDLWLEQQVWPLGFQGLTETSCYYFRPLSTWASLLWDDPALLDYPWDDRDVLVPPKSSEFFTCPLRHRTEIAKWICEKTGRVDLQDRRSLSHEFYFIDIALCTRVSLWDQEDIRSKFLFFYYNTRWSSNIRPVKGSEAI